MKYFLLRFASTTSNSLSRVNGNGKANIEPVKSNFADFCKHFDYESILFIFCISCSADAFFLFSRTQLLQARPEEGLEQKPLLSIVRRISIIFLVVTI